MIQPKIRPDEPGTQPGDVGNGRVLVIDERTQNFNGRKYHLKKGYYVCTVNKEPHRLHADVWSYHNGAPPEGYFVHHDHRNPDGSFDKNENNVEWLRLMTPSEHSFYHTQNKAPAKKIDVAVKVSTIRAEQYFVENNVVDDTDDDELTSSNGEYLIQNDNDLNTFKTLQRRARGTDV